MTKGAYVLIISLAESKEIAIGKLGTFNFMKGYYAYVGSAMSSLEHRIARHRGNDKKMHWHIDYFLKEADIVDVLEFPSENKEECILSRKTKEIGGKQLIAGFGSSDCTCRSHLFYFPKYPDILSRLSAKALD